jgi:hypothetical protein
MIKSKEEKIDIINTIIEIWGSITTTQLDLYRPQEISFIGRDKYGISLHISEYHVNYITVVSTSDKNELWQEIMYYDDLPDNIIDEILSLLIRYDSKMMSS